MRGNHFVIPPKLRPDILRHLHDGHQGTTKLKLNANSSVWWPGIGCDIEEIVANCPPCQKYRKERIEPMKGTEFPSRAWSHVGVDFFQLGNKHYLLAVDYFSRDIELCRVSGKATALETVNKLKSVFSRHGIADILFSDNGPQFSSEEFKQFSISWGFEHVDRKSVV